MYNLEELINIILSKSEIIEEEIKQKSDLINLTSRQLFCLEVVNILQNPTLTELSEYLNISKPSTTVMIDRLVEKEYVRKIKSDLDKRSAHLHLTEKGTKASLLHSKVHADFSRLLTKNLTTSEAGILELLLNKAIKSL